MSIVELSFAAFAVVGFLGILGIVVIVTGRAPKSFNWKKNLDKKALKEEYKEWIQASEGSKDQPHVLYANQINIEQL